MWRSTSCSFRSHLSERRSNALAHCNVQLIAIARNVIPIPIRPFFAWPCFHSQPGAGANNVAGQLVTQFGSRVNVASGDDTKTLSSRPIDPNRARARCWRRLGSQNSLRDGWQLVCGASANSMRECKWREQKLPVAYLIWLKSRHELS